MATHLEPSRTPAVPAAGTRTIIQKNSGWHGVYEDLLFRRGPINPPCTHRKRPLCSSNSLGTEERLVQSQNVFSTGQDGPLGVSASSFLQDFLSDSPKVRERGCTKIPYILRELGDAAPEFLLFLHEFEEGEDNEEVLMALCAELQRLFESFGDNAFVREKCCVPWLAEGFSSVSSLLLRMMLHRDRDLRAAALRAYAALISACTLPTFVKNKIVPQVLELFEDQRDAFRQTAALVLPAALHCVRRCSLELQKRQRPQEAAQDKQCIKDLQELKRQLITAYIGLCGDRNCAVQLAAGQQLPLFVDFIAAEVEALQRAQPLQQKLSDSGFAADAFEGDKEIGELMVAAYTATQKFTMSLHENCRMQAVTAVAVMARKNAAVFRTLGANFFQMLCSDSSWRVRASACLSLEDTHLLFCDSVAAPNGDDAGAGIKSAAGSCLPSLLFKFLTDRYPMVKMAALQVLPRAAQLLGNVAFVRDPWMLELNQLGEDEGASHESRLSGACLDALLALLPLATGTQRRAFLELAVELAQRGNWKLKLAFLKSMDSLVADELAFVSPVLLKEGFALDEDGEDCWRIHAAIAQQIPVLLSCGLEGKQEEDWWEQFVSLLLHPAWAVRQEAGAALRAVTQRGNRQQACPQEHALDQRIFRALQQVASSKNAFIRQELAFYLHQIWDYLASASVRDLAMALLHHLGKDTAPCCRLAVARFLRIQLAKDRTKQNPFSGELKTMLEKLSEDEDSGVRDEAGACCEDVAELLATHTLN